MKAQIDKTPLPETKRKLLDAAVSLMARQGYSTTTVDRVCSEAKLTKGSFFHYFRNKEDIGRAAMEHFDAAQQECFAAAGLAEIDDPVERLERFFDIMIAAVESPDTPDVCLVGMMAQELAETNEGMRTACEERFTAWAGMVSGLIGDAKKARAPRASFDPGEVAWMILSLAQGSMLTAKTRQDRSLTVVNFRHARAYVRGLLGLSEK